jgi:hypothetical protein
MIAIITRSLFEHAHDTLASPFGLVLDLPEMSGRFDGRARKTLWEEAS